MTRPLTRRHGLVAALALLLLSPSTARAHGIGDPAVRSVFDGVSPALPPGVIVEVRPSIIDELVVTNPTSTPLEVLAQGGEPFLTISSAGVTANLASPDWYTTGTPEGGPVVPPDVQRQGGRGAPRPALVSRQPVWAEFDPRLHPPVTVLPAARAAGAEVQLGSWTIPLRYGGRPYLAHGRVLFTPLRGGFTVGVAAAPAGLQVSALQGELPGLFLRVPAGPTVVVQGRRGEPFLRFAAGVVSANTASPSWAEDQRARGRPVAAVSAAVHWVPVARGTTYSWLDGRLRYPADVPTAEVLARSSASVVQRWTVPVLLDGAPDAITGTVTWVPRALAAQLVRRPAETGTSTAPGGLGGLLALLGGAAAVALLAVGFLVRRRRGTPAPR